MQEIAKPLVDHPIGERQLRFARVDEERGADILIREVWSVKLRELRTDAVGG